MQPSSVSNHCAGEDKKWFNCPRKHY